VSPQRPFENDDQSVLRAIHESPDEVALREAYTEAEPELLGITG
jgi:hypothetical protein